MNHILISSFDPFEKPYAGMDMDDEAQVAIEERDAPEIAAENIIEHGRCAIEHLRLPTELGVLQCLKLAGLTTEQIEPNLAKILWAAGPRFAHIVGGLRMPLAN